MSKLAHLSLGSALFVVLGLMITPANATPEIICTASASAAPIVRSAGLTEPVADYVLTCINSGTAVLTPVGSPVPQINLVIILNTNLTSRFTASDATGTYSEALALIDEPNTPPSSTWPNGHPLLNCGQTGAPDNGGLGPGVCEIVSYGDPVHTYDGTKNTYGITSPPGNAMCGTGPTPPLNSYTCGRPNAFQGRLLAGGDANVIEFLGIPFDPPPVGVSRIIRITNLRANGYLLAVPPPMVTPVLATVAISGSTSFGFSGSSTQTVGYVGPGLIPGGCGTPAASTVRLCEGFASSWKTRNLSFFVGDNLGTPGNATYTGPFYTYTGAANYPADLAQNVPGTIYFTESLFQWQNDVPLFNGPPGFPLTPSLTNPPAGFGGGLVPDAGNPLGSGGYTLTNTMPNLDGVPTAGTRFALQFSGVPPGASVQVPLTVNVFRAGCLVCVPTGVLALTNADAAGGGPYSAALTTTLGSSEMAVYEALYADPFSLEYADVPYTVIGGSSAGIVVSQSFAPFYSDSASGQASQTGYLPRFAALSGGILNLMGVIAQMNLPNGTTTSLDAKLNAALADVAANNLAGACSDLGALINEANAQSGKKLTVAEANTIISMAMALQAQLGC
jgi:hypothetical protein